MRWILPEPIEAGEVRSLADSLRVPVAIAELLWRRGYRTPESAKRHLEPRLASLEDPFELPDMEHAVERLLRAVDAGESIVLYGDYDVDGVTSLALLQRILLQFGARARCFLPVRDTEGYGLSAAGLDRCKRECSPTLLVAIDCGTSSVTEIAQLGREGIDVIVLDHHECQEVLPSCVALVNPKRGSRFEYLCSVGVVFKLAHAA